MKNMTWETKKIGDIAEIHRGASPRPIQNFLSEKGMPWVKIADATADTSRFISSTKECIKEAGVSRSVVVKPGTLIVSNSATPGLPKIMQITACVHDGWLVFSNYKGVLRDFLYYKFIDIRRRLTNQANGSVFQNLKTDIVKNFEITLPSTDIQEKIVSFLQSIDAKLENLTQINHNLEEQAKAIFKSWFVDFSALEVQEFFDNNGVLVPEGWDVSCLTNIADYLNGLAMQKYRPDDGDVGYPVLKIKELRQGMCDRDSERCSTISVKPEYMVHDGDVIFSWSGRLLVDFWCGGDCGLNQDLFKVTSTKFDKWFYYSWTLHHLNEFIAIAADKATTMGHIKRENLQAAAVLIPPEKIYNEIGKLLGPIYESIVRNRGGCTI